VGRKGRDARVGTQRWRVGNLLGGKFIGGRKYDAC
jgi:hypothetical protein